MFSAGFWLRPLLGVGLLTAFLAAAPQERPPVPDVAHAEEKRAVLQTCRVPPHLVVLPPQVEPDFIACANRYYRPETAETAHAIGEMLGREVAIDRIAIAEGFVRAYEITVRLEDEKQVVLLCNDKVTRCYRQQGALTIPKKD